MNNSSYINVHNFNKCMTGFSVFKKEYIPERFKKPEV